MPVAFDSSFIGLKSGDTTKQRGFTASGRADQYDKLAVFNVQAEFLYSDDALIGDLQVDLILL